MSRDRIAGKTVNLSMPLTNFQLIYRKRIVATANGYVQKTFNTANIRNRKRIVANANSFVQKTFNTTNIRNRKRIVATANSFVQKTFNTTNIRNRKRIVATANSYVQKTFNIANIRNMYVTIHFSTLMIRCWFPMAQTTLFFDIYFIDSYLNELSNKTIG